MHIDKTNKMFNGLCLHHYCWYKLRYGLVKVYQMWEGLNYNLNLMLHLSNQYNRLTVTSLNSICALFDYFMFKYRLAVRVSDFSWLIADYLLYRLYDVVEEAV